jgi:hypothetical protein
VINHYGNFIVTANVDGNYAKRGLPDPLVLAFYSTAQSDLTVQLIILRNRYDICGSIYSSVLSLTGSPGLLFGPDALLKTRALSNTIKHCFTTLNSLTSADCATPRIRLTECLLLGKVAQTFAQGPLVS